MDSLFHELGLPPYRLDQILPLIDKASSLSSGPQATSTQAHQTVVRIAESIEELAWLVEFRRSDLLPQYVQISEQPGYGICEMKCAPPDDSIILNSIAAKVLHLKSWVIQNFHQTPEDPTPGHNTARLCDVYHLAFRQLSKGPYIVNHEYLSEITWGLDGSPHYLLAVDSWPAFPVLQKRSLQGCDFCHFLHKQLLVVPIQDTNIYEPECGTSVWIEFCWHLSQVPPERSLECVKVTIKAIATTEVLFNVHTAHGKLIPRWWKSANWKTDISVLCRRCCRSTCHLAPPSSDVFESIQPQIYRTRTSRD